MNTLRMCLTVSGVTLLGACNAAAPVNTTSEDPVGVSEQPLAVNVWRGTWNGGQASASLWTETSYASVTAYENKTGKSRSVGLEVYVYEYDPTSLACQTESWCWDPADPSTCYSWEYCFYTRYSSTYGWGAIPMRDFGVGRKTAELHTDLAKAPSFTGTTCTQDGCGPATGTIDISWTANGRSTSSGNGTSSESYSFDNVSYSSRSVGQWSSASADVDGQVFGTEMSSAYGNISESKGGSVSKEVIKN